MKHKISLVRPKQQENIFNSENLLIYSSCTRSVVCVWLTICATPKLREEKPQKSMTEQVKRL